jgi:hypothetical protein
MARFRDRPTGELLVLLIAATVCGYVVVSVVLTIVLAIFTDKDITGAARNIADVINTMIGLLAGFLVGKGDLLTRKNGNGE